MAELVDDFRSRTLTKYRELNEQLKDFLKNLLLFEKSSLSKELRPSNPTDQGGISLLAVKNDLLLHYLINLMAVMSRRSTPNYSLNSASTRTMILRLCEIRTYLEKIRPIEQKLQYQIDKLLKTTDEQHLVHRANIDNFDTNVSNEQPMDEDEGKTKIYRPPKLVPTEIPDDLDGKNPSEKLDKRLEFLKRRAFHSEILDEYRAKFSDAPEEIFNTERSRLLKQNQAYKEKINYEEDYLKRLPQTKRERLQLQRSMNNQASEHLLDHLDDADILFDDNAKRLNNKKKSQLSRKTKKRLDKKKQKSTKRSKSRK